MSRLRQLRSQTNGWRLTRMFVHNAKLQLSEHLIIKLLSTIKKRLKAFRDASRGIAVCVTREPHGRFHVIAAALVIALAIVLHARLDDWCWLTLCIGFVLAMEGVNSSVERLADHISEEYHPLIRDAKDLAAGAVLLAAITSCIIAILRFWPLFMRALEK